MKRKPKSDAAIRKALKAGPRDVIDHLLVDAPPCDPDEDRAIETTPMSDGANTVLAMIRHLGGAISLDWTEANVNAIAEVGGLVAYESSFPARANIVVTYRPDPAVWHLVTAYCWDVPYVESREKAAEHAKSRPDIYAGWDEPQLPELTAEQAAAIAAEARFQAIEREAVLAAERELAAEAVAKALAPKKEAA